MVHYKDLEKLWFQHLHWHVGVIAKLILNLVLIPIPWIGVNGAAIGSVVCHMVAFTIVINVLRKNIKLDLSFSKFVIKPVFATFIMAICSYALFIILNGIIEERIATLIAIGSAILIYVVAIIVLKIFTKEEIYMIPYGKKIYKVLEKLRNL